jgi:hypothetical protein
VTVRYPQGGMTGSYHLVTEIRPVSMLVMAEQISATSGMSVHLDVETDYLLK